MNVDNPGFDEEEKTQMPNRKIDSGKIRKSLSWSAKYSGFEAVMKIYLPLIEPFYSM